MARRIRVWIDITDPGVPGREHTSAGGWDVYVNHERVASAVRSRRSPHGQLQLNHHLYDLLDEAMLWAPNQETFPL